MSAHPVLANHAVLAQCGGGIRKPMTTRRSGTESYSFPVQRLHAYVQGAPLAVCPKAWGTNRVWVFYLWIRTRLEAVSGSSSSIEHTEPVIMIDGIRAPARAMQDDPAQLYTLCPDPFQDIAMLPRGAALDFVADLSPLARAGLVQRILHARSARVGRPEWAGWEANTETLMWALCTLETLERATARELGGVQ